jgi:hypothetical protein
MMECPPMKTLKEFFDSDFTYCLPAPGGALADGGTRTNSPEDAFLAAVAARAKGKREPAEFLERKMWHLRLQRHFDEATDALMLERIGSWWREFAA